MVDTPTEEKRDSRFTPGPLTASGNGVHQGIRCVAITFDPENGRRDTEVAQANARLFAAAPDLYTFLQKIYLDHEAECNCEHNNEYCCAVVGEPCAKCHAFVALELVDGSAGGKSSDNKQEV